MSNLSPDEKKEKLKEIFPNSVSKNNLIYGKLSSEIDKLFPEFKNFLPLEYEIQGVGKVHYTLYEDAKDLYLKLKNDGIISYLENIHQLGVISISNPTSDHKKWEYISLQIYLIQKLKKSSLSIGLSSTNCLKLDLQSETILQIIILLINIGSIEGTTSASKAFLEFLKENNYRETLLKTCNPEWHQFINDTFQNDLFSNIKFILAIEYLNKFYHSEDIIYKIGKAFILEEYLTDNNFHKLTIILNRIRKISYLYLDTQNSNIGFKISITSMIINIDNFENLFNPNSTDWDNFLNSIEHMITKTLYISAKSSYLHKLNYENTLKQFKKNKDKILDPAESLIQKLTKINLDIKIEKIENPLIGQFYFDTKEYTSTKIHNLKDYKNYLHKINKIHLNIYNKHKNTLLENFILNENTFNPKIYFNFIFHKEKCNSSTVLKYNIYIFLEYLFSYLDVFDFKENTSNHAMSRKAIMYLLQMITKYKTKNIRFNSYISLHQQLNYDNCAINNFKNPYYSNELNEARVSLRKIKNNLKKSKFKYKDDSINCIEICLKILFKYRKDTNNQFELICSFLPFEIEKIRTNSKSLSLRDNPIKRSYATDVDSVLIIRNIKKKFFDIYFIESKRVKRGINTKITESFNNLKKCLIYDDLFEEIIDESIQGGWQYLRVKASN